MPPDSIVDAESPFGPLVSTDWLADHLHHRDVRILDCRWYLRPFDDREGDAEHRKGHIPGSVHVRWDTDLADPDRPASMVAGAARYAEKMGALGVGDDTFVVLYDDHHVPVAARVWWTLRLFGHSRAGVLDGGITSWVASGGALETGVNTPPPAVFTPRFQVERYATKDDVLRALADDDHHLVDARMDKAFDAASGTIPGAARLPALGFLADGEHWVTPAAARGAIDAAGLGDDKPVITFCGGGVAATGTALAYELAGLGPVAVYDGSWTEWEADPATPKALHQR
ncbi:MAG: sulfurtransferase [Actinomycetota bacterium]|jgi:thiosulfate/3-mercaptopyruvate sulfurtransferase|nr:MAG: rhodanese domain-containing protein [Acidimicrobiaceae bacterium]